MEESIHRLGDKNRLSRLLDVYGALLTDRQFEFLDLHCNEDLSYGEVAEMKNISRQAVHDAIQHGKRALERFESRLKLVEANAADCSVSQLNRDREELRGVIQELGRRLQEDIIYDTAPLRRLAQQLERMLFSEMEERT